MNELEQLRAEVEAVKLICVVLCGLIPTESKAALTGLVEATSERHVATLQYTKLSDAQIKTMKEFSLLLAGSSPPETS